MISRPGNLCQKAKIEILNSMTNAEETLTELRKWARKDPEAAMVWGQQHPDNAERNEVLEDACFQIAESDPERAVALAEQFNLSQDSVLENLAQQWAGKNLTAACNWITVQPAGDRRDALVTGMTFIWSQTEPVGAAQFVVRQMPPETAQDEAIMMVLHQWALVDPAGANAWV
jgi:DNA-binding transcriptional regulator YbjK